LQDYFTPYKGETLIYGMTPPANNKIRVNVASDGTSSIVVVDPAWHGSETHTATARNAVGTAIIDVKFTVEPVVGITPVSTAISTINAYPTVTSTYTTLVISSAEPADYTLSVYDIEGKLIENHRLSVSETVQKIIDFTNLPRGVYTCVVANENEKQSVKIVVE